MTTTHPDQIDAIRAQIVADYIARHPIADVEHCREAVSGMIGAVARIIRIEERETVAHNVGVFMDAIHGPHKGRRELRRSRHKIDGYPAEDYADDIAAALPLILQIVVIRVREADDRMKRQNDAEAKRKASKPPRGKHFTDKLAGRAA